MIVPPLNLAVRIAASILSVPPESIALCLPMMAPPPSSQGQVHHRSEIDSALNMWWDKQDGFDAPAQDQDMIDGRYRTSADDMKPSTYGEITFLGVRQLFDYMNMYESTFDLARFGLVGGGEKAKRTSDDIVFFDLGSGAGRLVTQSYLELPRIRRSVGVELATARHEAAVTAWNKLVESGDANRIRRMGIDLIDKSDGDINMDIDATCVEFHEGDLFQIDVSEATHIYASSLCFTDGMMADLADKLQTEAPSLQCIATLQKFPPGHLLGISHPAMEFVEMSWTKARGEGCPVYFYYRAKQ